MGGLCLEGAVFALFLLRRILAIEVLTLSVSLSVCCSHTHKHAYTHICTHTHSYSHTRKHTHVYTHTYTHTTILCIQHLWCGTLSPVSLHSQVVEGDEIARVCTTEIQLWLTLNNLVSDVSFRSRYEFTRHRKETISKVSSLVLHPPSSWRRPLSPHP